MRRSVTAYTLVAVFFVALFFSATSNANNVEVITLPEEAPGDIKHVYESIQLEEIIVTAQRKVESLQDAPISMAALNEETLEVRGVEGVANLSGQVPSLTIEQFPTAATTINAYIRGFGPIDSQITQDPAVGVYLNGVYIARSMGLAFDVADLERVEVLRGPQGTLYGRNTTGGAISLITKLPEIGSTWVSHGMTGGSQPLLSTKTTLNLALGEAVAAKLGLFAKRQDGFMENTGPGGDFGDRESLAGRFDILWEPADNFSLLYSYDHNEVGVYNPMYQAVLTPEGDKGEAELVKREAQSHSVFSASRLDSLATGMPLEESSVRVSGHAVTIEKDFGELAIKYIGAQRKMRESYYIDLGGGAGSLDYRLDSHAYDGPAARRLVGGASDLVIPYNSQEQQSHELQLSSDAFDGRLEYIMGAFWFSEKGADVISPTAHQFSIALNPLAGAIPIVSDLISGVGPRMVQFVETNNTMRNKSLAGFVQGTWTPPILSDRLELTAGFRHTEDDRRATKTRRTPTLLEQRIAGTGVALEVPALSGPTFDEVPAARKFSNNSVSFIAALQVTDNANLYAKYVESYKSGGFNLRDPDVSGETATTSADGQRYDFGFTDGFDKEVVDTVEVGLKSEWLGRRLRLNISAFESNLSDMQISFAIAGSIADTKTTNAGESEVSGVELDGRAALTSDLSIDFSYAYLDADITEVIDRAGNDVTDQFIFNSAPKHSYSVGVTQEFSAGDWGAVFVSAGYQYLSERHGAPVVGKSLALPAYGLANGYIGIAPYAQVFGGQLSLSLWVRNIFDKDYVISAMDQVPHSDRAVLWGAARNFGVGFKFDFE